MVVLKNKALLSVMLAVLMAAGLLALVEPARAAFPGQNGKIAFSSNRSGDYDIYTVSPTGVEVDLDQRTTQPATDQEPAYSPDGSKIAFRSTRSGNYDIWTVNTTGAPQFNRITNDTAADVDPAWSPDGSRIAFSSNRNGDYDIYTVSSTGVEVDLDQRTTQPATDQRPAYSPDGNKIVFESNRTNNNYDIWTVSSTGAPQFNRITNDTAIDEEPAYSPDGSRIAFSSNRSGNGDIYTVSSTGVEVDLDQRTTQPALDEKPAYSPDGSKIAYDSDRSGNYDIWTVTSTGTSRFDRITDNTAIDYAPDWQSLAGPSPGNNTAPTIDPIAPAPGSKIKDRTPLISATVQDAETDLDGSTIKLFLDGTERNASYDRATDKLTYQSANLARGPHTVRIEATDAQGLRTVEQWSFRIKRRE